MTRYKGRTSPKAIERDFPHVVETVVPEGGLGKTLDAMHEFYVRFTPESGHVRCNLGCPLWANSGHRAPYSITLSARC